MQSGGKYRLERIMDHVFHVAFSSLHKADLILYVTVNFHKLALD
jgi:hypothetical protein